MNDSSLQYFQKAVTATNGPMKDKQSIIKHTILTLNKRLRYSNEQNSVYRDSKELCILDYPLQLRITYDASMIGDSTKDNNGSHLVVFELNVPTDSPSEMIRILARYDMEISGLGLSEFLFTLNCIPHDWNSPIFCPISCYNDLPTLMHTLLFPFLDFDKDEEGAIKKISPTINPSTSGIFPEDEIMFNNQEKVVSIHHNYENLFRMVISVNSDSSQNQDNLDCDDI